MSFPDILFEPLPVTLPRFEREKHFQSIAEEEGSANSRWLLNPYLQVARPG